MSVLPDASTAEIPSLLYLNTLLSYEAYLTKLSPVTEVSSFTSYDANVINIYNPYDVSSKLLVEIPTNVDDGYPVCIDISPEGTNLVAAYVVYTEYCTLRCRIKKNFIIPVHFY